MDDIKTGGNKTNYKETLNESDDKIDVSLFDDTLKQIEKTLKNLGEKIEPEQRLLTNKNLYKEKTNIGNEEHAIDNTNSSNEEHVIDDTHIRMEELHNFSADHLIKDKSHFGFYTYLALTIGIIFAMYEVLNIYKNLIILKYPFTETYIEYFYEVIEILAYLILNLVTFIRNLF
jgi:hypothetical protein